MLLFSLGLLYCFSLRASGAPAEKRVSGLKGLDVSSLQGAVNWPVVKKDGATFAYVKATEGTYYRNPDFAQQYDGSYEQGLIRGAYHFGIPSDTSGAAQAKYFVAHGGGWSDDGKTLPGMLDIEYNPYGAECYGLSKAAMTSWIEDFSNTYHSSTKRYPVIYTTTDWWRTCTSESTSFAKNNPLFIAAYTASVGALPPGWTFYTFWQYNDHGVFPGDQDVFNGGATQLKKLATG